MLSRRYRTQASEGSFNNEIGVPLTLLALKRDTERAVIEMGMYTTGEIAQLCEWALPRIGVVLNVGPVHLERAGSLDAIVRAKRELVEALPEDQRAAAAAESDKMMKGIKDLRDGTDMRKKYGDKSADAVLRHADALAQQRLAVLNMMSPGR